MSQLPSAREQAIAVWAVIVVCCGAIWYAAFTTGCGASPLSPAQAADIVETSADITKCQAAGRASNSYRVYDCCMIKAGHHFGSCVEFVDGGSDARD